MADEIQSKDEHRIDRLEEGLTRLTQIVADGFLAVSQKSAPNLMTMLTFAAVIIAFMTAVLAPVGYFAIREWDRSEKALASVSDWIQAETAIAKGEARERSAALEKQVDNILHNGTPGARERLAAIEAREKILTELQWNRANQ